ncbi:zinc finger MYM-type protein 1-like [Olea europaea var. sylvestris]|uniref:zinc finger MYM-type protein 1-like n=1 Tax=Olea europaea var. sylvestris TaxID=158386 RepID=UPI000C1D81B2|nr:zinc finger MYM-type protein 1-like [Olea europaea var. sylvestris]
MDFDYLIWKKIDVLTRKEEPCCLFFQKVINLKILQFLRRPFLQFHPQKLYGLHLPILIRDLGKRKQICEHPRNERGQIRRAYLNVGPYQPKPLEHQSKECGKQKCRFQERWYNQFPGLEYSPSTHKAYCFYCFLFLNESTPPNISSLVTIGFDSWKRVNQGSKCAFLIHVGTTSSSFHNCCKRSVEDLMKPTQHIDKVMHSLSNEEIQKNRLRLKTTIMSVKWLALQSCSFRGHDESPSSLNRGNFIELVDAFGKMNIEVGKIVLGNAPKNATYTFPDIQKEILNIMANKVRQTNCGEIGVAKFSILVDEARDESSQEQMAIILRFVRSNGILTGRFFAIKSVSDTTSLNLNNQISDVLVRFDLQVKNMRGQGYDGANNMRGSWNGLHALFLKNCPYAFYVHCFAHRLQLTLISAVRDVSDINSFFSHLDSVINMITSSPKRINELKSTRWPSHYSSVKSLIDMYAATCKVLEYLSDHSPNTLQKKTQDILTAMRFVCTTKTILQTLREDGWEEFLEEVKCFCSKNDIHVPDFDASYMVGRSCGREYPTVEHHYHFDIFNAAIDFLMMELDTRFNETSLELLSLSAALDQKDSFESFNIDNICKLAEKFYPENFSQQDIYCLKVELQHYQNDVIFEPRFQVPTLSDLCRELVASRRSESYVVLTKLICLVLTLPISTATVERAFSAMKHVKTKIRNKMDDGFLADCLTLNIEREFSMNLDLDSIVDEFYALKHRRVQLQ